MSRRTVTSATKTSKSPTMKTDLDDWETDPDFIRNIDEIDQRWGSARTVGSINMNELINDVRRDHQLMREKFQHPSQRDHSEGFGGKFGIQHDRKDSSAQNYDYHEELSKHSSQEISRKVIGSKEKLDDKNGSGSGSVSEARRAFLERTEGMFKDARLPPNIAPKPDFGDRDFTRPSMSQYSSATTSLLGASSKSPVFEESTSRRFISEEKKKTSSLSSSSSPSAAKELPRAIQSIQEKIDAFKKEFEDIENKVYKKSDLSKVIKRTTEVEKSSNVQYVSRTDDPLSGDYNHPSAKVTSTRQVTSTSPFGGASKDNLPKANIKSLSEKFETLRHDDEEDFKRRTEAKRREFFDQIKHQVLETRKNLDGFDPIDDTDISNYTQRSNNDKSPSSAYGSSPSNQQPYAPAATKVRISSPSSKPSPSRLSESSPLSSQPLLSSSSSVKPKVYTRSEITKEESVSKIVKENDKIIENETKTNVERRSSFHGSSDDEQDNEPTSIKFIDQKLRTSPLQQERTESPVEELKRRIPVVETQVKGGGIMARALYEYTAAEEDELNFDVDDLITNIEKLDPGWYKGTIIKNEEKKEGLFPANHVKLLNE